MSDTFYGSESGFNETFVTSWAGSIPPTVGGVAVMKISQLVFLQFPLVTALATASANIVATQQLPANIAPTTTFRQPFTVIQNNIAILGEIEVTSGAGNITIWADLNTALFTDATTNGFKAQLLAPYVVPF